MTARSAAVDAEDRKFANNTPKCESVSESVFHW